MQLRMRQRVGDERGATLVLMAFIMIVLLASAGLVVNVGLVRADRQRNKSVADVAVAAGMRGLNLGGFIAPFRGACAALDYVMENHPELSGLSLASGWSDGSTPAVAIAGNPCDSSSAAYAANYDTLCDNTTITSARSSFAWFSGTANGGDIEVTVKAGYPASDMTADGFGDDSYHSDQGEPTQHGCDQLAVIVKEKEDPGFGRVVGATELSSRIRSVGRVTVRNDVKAVIALLLLERDDCNVLSFSGTNSAVRVKGNGDRPGIVHADSIASPAGDNCNNQILSGVSASTADGYSGPSILAEQAETGGPPPESGRVSVSALAGYAGANPGKAATACPSTVLGAPGNCVTGSTRKGRGNVDVLYRQRMIDLRVEAALWTSSAPAGFTVFPDCASVPAVVTQQRVFINCSSFNSATVFTANNAEVVIAGRIFGSNDIVFENPAKVYVRDGVSRSGGILSVNAGISPDCTARGNNALGGDRSKSTKFVVLNGSFSASGGAINRMCQTMLFLADATSTGGSCDLLPAIPTSNNVAPYDNCFDGNLSLSGGGAFDWTAPDATDNPMSASDPADATYLDDFEDLAFWTETQNGNSLSGGGANVMKGIFFLPNADPFTISGGAAQAIERDAQFITRKLRLTGNGLLTMRPNPNNSVTFPYFESYDLVR